MKKFFLATLVLAVMLSFSVSAQDKKVDQKNTVKTTVVTEKSELNKICPVSGEEADGDIVATYKGKNYAVCCKSCLKKFNKDPEKYIKKLEQNKESK